MKRFNWKRYLSLILPLVSAALVPPAEASLHKAAGQKPLANTPPVVQITKPQNNEYFEWNTLIRYTIRVSDKEDGDSEFQEITPNEVLLQVVYLPDAAKAEEYIQNGSFSAPDAPGLALIRTSDCFGCHAVKDKSTGPAFAQIAQRYPNTPATITLLAGHILQGTSGVWGSVAMPPHPDFTQAQAEQIAQWIVEKTNDPNQCYYAGTEGSFRTQPKPDAEIKGVYLLSARYTDHGAKEAGKQKLRGHHTILLHHKP